MLIQFDEKHGTRLIEGRPGDIALKIITERLKENWFYNWDEGDEATQYEDRTKRIVAEKDTADAWRFISERRDHEYEGFEEVRVEQA